MLKWAREKAGLSLADVALKEKLPEERLSEWERGEGTPTLAQLRRLAKRYKRPLMVFYLEEPPKDFEVVKDFRILPSSRLNDFSPELRYQIRFVQEKQFWASTYLNESGYAKIDLVGSASVSHDPQQVANDLRTRLGVTISEQAKHTRSDLDSFTYWRDVCETVGVFVFQASGIPLEEMRGFALPDHYAPAVVLNPKDGYRPRTFTLIHEMVHIVIGQSAITNTSYLPLEGVPRIERFCNRVAAETIIPETDFRVRVPRHWMDNDEEVINLLAKRYGVSRQVIVIRLLETGFANKSYCLKKLAAYDSIPPKPKPTKVLIPQHQRALSRNGRAFSRLALSAYQISAIHGGELASLLGMKLNHLSSLEAKLYPARAQSVLEEE